MDYFKIQGGKVLNGDIYINGAKNSVLELMAASILTDEPVILHNVPNLSDVATMLEMLAQLGTKINWDKEFILYICILHKL